MFLVTAAEMRECDKRTIEGIGLPEPTPGLLLMERAGAGSFLAIRSHFRDLASFRVVAFCGKGNNGGDGLVVARYMRDAGMRPLAVLSSPRERLSPDAQVQLQRFEARGGEVRVVASEEDLQNLEGFIVRSGTRRLLLLDALLGTGTKGAPRGTAAAIIGLMGRLKERFGAKVVAIDTPSGVDVETGDAAPGTVDADLTATMAFPKVGFLFHPARRKVGAVRVVQIGIPNEVPAAVGLKRRLFTMEDARALFPHRAPDAHKGRVGRILIVGGSPGLTGAPAMAGLGAARVGAGLVTVAVPEGLNLALEAKLTEVMTLPLPQTQAGGIAAAAESVVLTRADRTDVWVLGPGLGSDPESRALVRSLIGRISGPLVVDADGLNALSEGSWQPSAEAPWPVLTPHPGEMARLVGMERLDKGAEASCRIAARFAAERGVVVVLKAATTVVAAPSGEVWINPTGNAGLATGGSGDLLTGIIAGFLGQGLKPEEAACLGVFTHGLAADLVARKKGPHGLIPSDVLDALPEALLALGSKEDVTDSNPWVHGGRLPIVPGF